MIHKKDWEVNAVLRELLLKNASVMSGFLSIFKLDVIKKNLNNKITEKRTQNVCHLPLH